MRSLAAGAVIILLLAVGAAPVAAAIANAIPNGSFETPDPQHPNLPLGFVPQRTDAVAGATSAGGKMAWEATGHWGAHSVSITNPTAADFGYWQATVPVKPSTAYVLSVYARCQTTGGQPEVVVMAPGKSFKDPGGFDWYLPVVTDWNENQRALKTVPGQTQLTIQLVLYNRGGQKVWFDDMALAEAASLPRLLSAWPASGSVLSSPDVDFVFQPAEAGGQYLLAWAQNAYFSRGNQQSQPFADTHFKPAQPLAPGTWYWRVGALGDDGRPYFTPTQNFLISSGTSPFQHADTTPPALYHVSPAPDSTLAGKDLVISASFADAGSGINIKSVRVALDGKDLTANATITETGASVRPSGLAQGVHTVEIKVQDAAGNDANACVWQFGLGTPVAVQGRFDQSGRFQLNGRPYFPMGLYSYCLNPGSGQFDETLLTRATDAGFNGMLVEDTGAAEIMDVFLKHGMKVMLQAGAGLKESTDDAKAKAALVDKGPARWKDNPALLGYWADEPDQLGPDKLARGYAALKAADPDHPAMWCLCDASKYHQNSATMDGMMPDIYPVPSTPISVIYTQIRQALADSGNKPIWFIPQAFDWAITNGNKVNAPGKWRPTAPELRVMTYLGLVAGARGIFYWAADTDNMNDIVWYAAQWDEALKTASELRYLAPILAAGQPLPGAKAESSEQEVFAQAWQADGRRVMMVVNAATAPVEVHITLPGATQVNCLFEDRKLTNGSDFRDLFRPYEVHVYEWR